MGAYTNPEAPLPVNFPYVNLINHEPEEVDLNAEASDSASSNAPTEFERFSPEWLKEDALRFAKSFIPSIFTFLPRTISRA
ncbi:hypothetical protein NHQ30_011347 [Ciborinia camelliae]|nr:hypothetical protein NHQ30_011347 [Ciborinia camelliae]